jgi:uncharacterized protein YuzE
MDVSYGRETDTLTLVFRAAKVSERDEQKPGIILDYAAAGLLVSAEILDASKHVPDFPSIQFKVAV